jgi:osmoprotectant transport system permease protein
MSSAPLNTYITDRLPELWLRLGEHLLLTGCSTIAAMFIGIPLGIYLFRKPWLRNPVLGIAGILQTIPSLAMLAFLLTLLQTIGAWPAIIALTLYALLPILRNTVTGLEGVPAEVMEAARGIGMKEYQELKMVRFPLAAPVILAGIRTAAVIAVGIATLSAFIGAGGLGQFINRGLALSNTPLILMGAVPAALLALIVDFSLGAFEWGIRPQRGKKAVRPFTSLIRHLALSAPLLLMLAGATLYLTGPSVQLFNQEGSGKETGRIRIGSKNFTEQLILGEILAQLIEARTALSVERVFNLGGTMICHGALVGGAIDLYAEYTGTGLTTILKHPLITDPNKALQRVKSIYSERFGVTWLEPFGFNNTYALAVRGRESKKSNWNSISDLKRDAPKLIAGFTAEFAERPDGYPGLQKTYGLGFRAVKDLDPAIMYQAISQGAVDVICAFATDGRIASLGLKTLEDDLRFFPPYYAAPVINDEVMLAHPELIDVLSLLGDRIDDATMRRLNGEVDTGRRSPREVAESFLKAKNLL